MENKTYPVLGSVLEFSTQRACLDFLTNRFAGSLPLLTIFICDGDLFAWCLVSIKAVLVVEPSVTLLTLDLGSLWAFLLPVALWTGFGTAMVCILLIALKRLVSV